MRRLTEFDEFPRHQIGETFDTVGDGSPHWSDGYYFTMGDDAGRYAWFMGFRLHANNDVLDAFTCVSVAGADGSHAGRQHNMRWSRRLRPRIDALECGPVTLEVVEGLRTLRTRCAPNARGQAYDLLWEGFAPPYNEDHVRVVVNGRLHSDRSNYLQCSNVSGWFEVGGERVEVDGWSGVRDHSWGIGNNTGGPRAKAVAPPPDPAASPGLRQWCVFRMRDRVVYWQFHSPGAALGYTKFEGNCSAPYDGDPKWNYPYSPESHDVTFVDGPDGPLPRLAHGVVHLRRPDGGIERYGIEPISYPVYLQGGGYFGGYDDGQGRGVYRGDLRDEGEVWEIDRGTSVVTPNEIDLNRARLRRGMGAVHEPRRPDRHRHRPPRVRRARPVRRAREPQSHRVRRTRRMKALVLGGSVFVGRRLVEMLVASGHDTAVLNRGRTPADMPDGVTRLVADRTDPESMRAALGGTSWDAVYDVSGFVMAAGGSDIPALLELLDGSVGHYVFVSSIMAYDQSLVGVVPWTEDMPTEADASSGATARTYGGFKAVAERAMLARHAETGFPASVVRPAAIYGPANNIFDMETPMFLRLLQNRPILLPHSGLVTVSYGHVDDLCRMMVEMTGAPVAFGEVFNATSEAVTTRRYVDVLAEIVGVEPMVVSVPEDALPTLPSGVFGHLFSARHHAVLSTDKARRLLGFEPTYDFRSGHAQTYGWFRAQGWADLDVALVDPVWRATWDFDAEAAASAALIGA